MSEWWVHQRHVISTSFRLLMALLSTFYQNCQPKTKYPWEIFVKIYIWNSILTMGFSNLNTHFLPELAASHLYLIFKNSHWIFFFGEEYFLDIFVHFEFNFDDEVWKVVRAVFNLNFDTRSNKIIPNVDQVGFWFLVYGFGSFALSKNRNNRIWLKAGRFFVCSCLSRVRICKCDLPIYWVTWQGLWEGATADKSLHPK